MYVDLWTLVLEVDIIISLYSQMIYRDMDMSTWWNTNSNHLKYSNDFVMKKKNKLKKNIKTLQSDRGGEYLSSNFLTYLGENEILSQ